MRREILDIKPGHNTTGCCPGHDDKHVDGSLATAAACYVSPSHYRDPRTNIPVDWTWAAQWWKPKDRRRNLVRAAALIIAEIERFDRGVRRMIEQRED